MDFLTCITLQAGGVQQLIIKEEPSVVRVHMHVRMCVDMYIFVHTCNIYIRHVYAMSILLFSYYNGDGECFIVTVSYTLCLDLNVSIFTSNIQLFIMN